MKRLIFALTFLILFSCAKHAYFSSDEDIKKIALSMKRVVLLPVLDVGWGKPPAVCPTKAFCHIGGVVLERGPNVMFNMLYQVLEEKGWNVIIPDEVDMERFRRDPIGLCREVAKKYRVDGVFLPYLFVYRDREGSSLAVKRPASIVLSLYLYSADKKSIVWMGDFSQVQKPVSYNLLDLTTVKAGFKFVTVDELAEKAARDILKDLPNKGEE